MTSFTVSALVERRREVQREIAYLESEIKRAEEAIGHIDATIHLLDPYYDLTKHPWGFHHRFLFGAEARPRAG